MSHVFGSTYAAAYDGFYHDKDYRRECDLLEEAFRRFGTDSTRSVLDIGCGTGGHAIQLAQRGYEVAGADRSSHMLERARQKAAAAGVTISLHEADALRSLDLGREFDAATMMFAVLGYQYENADVLGALRAARRHLHPGGVFAFDVWYGPCVLSEKPGDRVKIFENGGTKLLRAASGRLDTMQHCCEVRYHVWELSGTTVVSETTELHRMRYFFPQELRLLLDQTGFRLESLTEFPTLDRPPDETSWNVFAVASAC